MFRNTSNAMYKMNRNNMYKKPMYENTFNNIKKENDKMMKTIQELNTKHENFKKKILDDINYMETMIFCNSIPLICFIITR
jgi:hypothetical protein